jgi:hypothetical protein
MIEIAKNQEGTTKATEQINLQMRIAAYEEEEACKRIKDHVKEMKSVFERAAQEMQRYFQQIEDIESGTYQAAKIEEVYSWALNEVENRVRNLNTSNAISNSTRYVSAKDRMKMIRKIQSAQ